MTSGGRRLHRLQRRRTVAHRFDLKSSGEQAGQIVAHVGVVVGDQNSGRRAGRARRCRSVSAGVSEGSHRSASSTYGVAPEARGRRRSITRRRDRRDPFRRKVRRADRETHREHRSFSEDAGDVDGAAVDGDQLADQGQADAGTLVRARRRPFDAVKSIEHVGEIVRRDADPGVSHAELDVSVGRRHRHPDRALERELERVRQQIEDDLLPHLAVDVDRGSATADSRRPVAALPARWPIGTRWRDRR